jgi:hypothetical protein
MVGVPQHSLGESRGGQQARGEGDEQEVFGVVHGDDLS